MGSFAGRLAEVQENDNAGFLPQSAESTLVLEELLKFTGSETIPSSVVFEREGGLTADDKAAIEDYAGELGQVDDVDTEGVSAPQYSEDGTAAQVDRATARHRRGGHRRHHRRPARRGRGPTRRADCPGRRPGRRAGRLRGSLRSHRRHPPARRRDRCARHPAAGLPVAGAAAARRAVRAALSRRRRRDRLHARRQRRRSTSTARARGSCSSWRSAPRPTTPCSSSPAFREELRDTESKYDAMRSAYRRRVRADRCLRAHRDPGPAVPAALRPVEPAGSRTGRRDRHRLRHARRADRRTGSSRPAGSGRLLAVPSRRSARPTPTPGASGDASPGWSADALARCGC